MGAWKNAHRTSKGKTQTTGITYMKTSSRTTKKGPDVRKLIRTVRSGYEGAFVTVGVQGSSGGDYADSNVTVAQVALWNEFGTPNAEHPTPERSFIHSTLNENKDLIEKWRVQGVVNVMTKGWPVRKALEMLGMRMVVLIQNKIKSNIPPENAAWTLERKKALDQGTDTLMATKKLSQSISFVVHMGHERGANPAAAATQKDK